MWARLVGQRWLRGAGRLSVSAHLSSPLPTLPHHHTGTGHPAPAHWITAYHWEEGEGGWRRRRGRTEVLLLSIGVVLCASDRESERQFLVAAKDGDRAAMQRLLQKGVDINSRHPLGWTALHVAVVTRNSSLVRFLVENGADVNCRDEYSSASRVARQQRTSSDRVAVVRDREFSSRLNHYVSYSGFTPLHYAVVLDEGEMVHYLLERGADPTIQNSRGLSPNRYCTDDGMRELLAKETEKVLERRERERLKERRLFPLEERLKTAIVGQEGPIKAAAAAIRRKELGWADSDHPLVFLFLGSSGIGKTELAKQIAKYIHKDNEKGFIRLDMSEYQEKHEVAKLIGAPPGYLGFDQGGQLTSRLRECPNAVVLFDEVDKAHPDVLTVMLQLFDEGRLTNGQGNTIDCKDALFVMTSNIASEEIAKHGLKLRKEAEMASSQYHTHKQESEEISREFKEQVVEPILKRHFKYNEFLGRINEMLYFLPFSREELNTLVERELLLWQERARKRHSIVLCWDHEVLDILADGYNIKYGARSIQHEVQRRAINQLAAAYEQQLIARGSCVRLVVVGDEGEAVRVGLVVGKGEERKTITISSCNHGNHFQL